jgi:hypothetical protein
MPGDEISGLCPRIYDKNIIQQIIDCPRSEKYTAVDSIWRTPREKRAGFVVEPPQIRKREISISKL